MQLVQKKLTSAVSKWPSLIIGIVVLAEQKPASDSVSKESETGGEVSNEEEEIEGEKEYETKGEVSHDSENVEDDEESAEEEEIAGEKEKSGEEEKSGEDDAEKKDQETTEDLSQDSDSSEDAEAPVEEEEAEEAEGSESSDEDLSHPVNSTRISDGEDENPVEELVELSDTHSSEAEEDGGAPVWGEESDLEGRHTWRFYPCFESCRFLTTHCGYQCNQWRFILLYFRIKFLHKNWTAQSGM